MRFANGDPTLLKEARANVLIQNRGSVKRTSRSVFHPCSGGLSINECVCLVGLLRGGRRPEGAAVVPGTTWNPVQPAVAITRGTDLTNSRFASSQSFRHSRHDLLNSHAEQVSGPPAVPGNRARSNVGVPGPYIPVSVTVFLFSGPASHTSVVGDRNEMKYIYMVRPLRGAWLPRSPPGSAVRHEA
jgi:hypothetical protein